MKIVEIVWEDICSYTGWELKDIERTPLKIKSVGYLHEKNKRQVVIYQSSDKYGKITEALVIPRSVIKSIKVLK